MKNRDSNETVSLHLHDSESTMALCHTGENCTVMQSVEKQNEKPGGGGGVLPYKRLVGMCRWMGSHFHGWIDYNGVTFLVQLLEWDRTFSGFLG